MTKHRASNWRKLDNAALAFPAVTNKNDTRVFRFYCMLKEMVDGEVLQKALDRTMDKYPLFQTVLRKGLFWFYLERRDIRPEAKKEERPPCSRLYIPDKKTLLFEVTYHENRINFEVFHALTDGTGAMHFLQELVKNYLQLSHPAAELPELYPEEEITGKDMEEDSFSQYYSADIPKAREKKERAFQIKGELVPQEEMGITEVMVPVKEILTKAREYGVTVTVLAATMLLCAIHQDVPKNQMKKPIGLMIPVNLRNYFPSQSMANFFGWIEVRYQFLEDTEFKDVLYSVKEQFERELSKERIEMRMNDLVRLEKNPVLRMVPLELKTLALQAGTSFGGRGITAVYSNVGVVKMPEQYGEFIERYGFFASTNSLQLCSCSYGDVMSFGLTTKRAGNDIQRNFTRCLKEEGFSFTERNNDFPGCFKEPKKTGKKIFETFTFLCIVIAVLCTMLDYMTDRSVSFSWFVLGGCFCTWLLVSVGYRKRRNILKNEMWQLLLITGLAVLWDIFTGWRGWSVDYVMPLVSLAVLCSMPVIAKVRHLEAAEYLFYLIQASVFGWIPMILVWTGVVKTPYPAVICAGISFLVVVGLFLFRRKEVFREIHKKLRA